MVDGGETLGETGGRVGHLEFAEAEGTDGVAAAEADLPAFGRPVGGEKFGGLSAGVDDGEAGFVLEERVFGYGEEAELGFLIAGDDLDGGVLSFGFLQELLGVGGDAEGHRPAGEDFLGTVVTGGLEGVFEGGESVGLGLGGEETSGFCALSEPGDGGGFVDCLPGAVGRFLGDEEQDGV